MGHKSFKPYTPGRRQMTVSSFDEITTNRPEKSLLAPIHNHGGRNNSGKTTVRHQGGGHKRKYRICLLYTSPSPRDVEESRMPSSA